MNLSIFILLASILAAAVPPAPALTSGELKYVENDPVVTHKVMFTMSRNKSKVGDLVIGLFGGTVPKSVENFVGLLLSLKGYGYQNTRFHRIIRDFMVQGGDFEKHDGTGGYSVFEEKYFDDENFEIRHNKRGRVSMANRGPNSNGAQFFITTRAECDWLDGKHVVVGQLIGGFDVLDKMNEQDSLPDIEWVIEASKVVVLGSGDSADSVDSVDSADSVSDSVDGSRPEVAKLDPPAPSQGFTYSEEPEPTSSLYWFLFIVSLVAAVIFCARTLRSSKKPIVGFNEPRFSY